MAESAAFADEHLDVARQVSDQLAIAIRQAQLHEQVQRHIGGLEARVMSQTGDSG